MKKRTEQVLANLKIEKSMYFKALGKVCEWYEDFYLKKDDVDKSDSYERCLVQFVLVSCIFESNMCIFPKFHKDIAIEMICELEHTTPSKINNTILDIIDCIANEKSMRFKVTTEHYCNCGKCNEKFDSEEVTVNGFTDFSKKILKGYDIDEYAKIVKIVKTYDIIK